MDGTATDIVFHLDNDEHEVLHWIGLPYLCDGERQWFDLAACPAEEPATPRLDERYPALAGREAELVQPALP